MTSTATSPLMRRSEARTPSLLDRVRGSSAPTGPLTETVKKDYAVAADAFGAVLEKLRGLIDGDLRRLARP